MVALAPPEKIIAGIDKLMASSGTLPDRMLLALKLLAFARARIEADADWEAHGEILAGKALAAAHDAVHRASVEEITVFTAASVVAGIIDTVSGLIDRAVLDTLNDTLRSLRA